MLCANCGRELETGTASGAAYPAAPGAATLVGPGAEAPAGDSLRRWDERETDR